MILKRKTQNTLALSLTLFTLLFLSPFITKSQNTIPSTTVSGVLSVDSTMTSSDLVVSGTGRIDSSLVVGDTMHAQDIVISGGARVAGNINLGGGVFFKNGAGISVSTNSTSNNEIYSYGKSITGQMPTSNPCLNPNPPYTTHQFGGFFQIYDNGPSGYTGGNILSLQSWFNGSSIDVSGQGGLLINYFCGKDLFLGTGTGSGGNVGTAGAKVFVGDEFLARGNAQIGAHQAIDPTVKLNILNVSDKGLRLWALNPSVKLIDDGYDQFTVWGNGSSHWGQNMQIGFVNNSAIQDANTSLNINNLGIDGIKFNTWNNAAKLISISNSNLSSSPFIVYGDGRLNIKTNATNAIDVMDISGKINFRVKTNGELYTRYVKVTMQNFPDYVFEKDYKLLEYSSLEEFILKNKHLPNIPSASEIEKESADLGQLQKLNFEKTEELFLYVIDLNKRLSKLEKENEELKTRLKEK